MMGEGMVKHAFLLFMGIVILALVGCTTEEPEAVTVGTFQSAAGRDLRIVAGQRVYVPAYSEVFLGRRSLTRDLAVTLAVHNTDLDASIFLQSVRFHDTDGNLVREYVEETLEVAPLATKGFIIESADRRGGWGSNFLVEWVAEEPVYEPIIEAVMISTGGTQGLSMISLGRVLSQTEAPVEVPDTTEE